MPKSSCFLQKPPSWLNILNGDGKIANKSFFSRLKAGFADVFIIKRFLDSLDKQSKTIFFVEGFDIEHFVFLFLAICFSHPSIQFWILHRYVFARFHKKTLFFKLFHWLFETAVGKKNVHYLTDSELLAKKQQEVYGRTFNVISIPHAQESFQKTRMHGEKLLLWWPGGSVREEKGLKYIQRISRMICQKKNVQLVVAESARKFLPQSLNVLFVPTEISRDEYVNWMHQTDLVLLPYSSKNYAYRSSGIFVESVSMGAIPVVSQQTWMAYELKNSISRNWQLIGIVKTC